MSHESSAVVFDVQRFSIHDGPGIRTVVFFKGCGLACKWCQNPEGRHPPPELAYHADRCIESCRDCIGHCPEGALLDRVEGRVRWDACTHCGACVDPCPSGALTMVGEAWSDDRLLDAVLADRSYYEASGGGVTFSGGEPVLASKFLTKFLRRAKQAGLHLVLETSGQYPFALLEPLLDHLDLILFDVKGGGGEQPHLELVGHGDELIQANLRRLLARTPRPEVEVRMPVIPGLNDDDASLDQLCPRLLALGIERLTLLPYNHLWEAKLRYLDTKQAPLGIAAPGRDHYRALERRFAQRGVTAILA